MFWMRNCTNTCKGVSLQIFRSLNLRRGQNRYSELISYLIGIVYNVYAVINGEAIGRPEGRGHSLYPP
jgi:hypothetical protein